MAPLQQERCAFEKCKHQSIAQMILTNGHKKTASEWKLFFYGAGDEARTRYLHLGKVALYRMSYTRGTRLIIAEEAKMSRTFSVWAVFLLKTAAWRRR